MYRLYTKGAIRRVKKISNAHIFEAILAASLAHASGRARHRIWWPRCGTEHALNRSHDSLGIPSRQTVSGGPGPSLAWVRRALVSDGLERRGGSIYVGTAGWSIPRVSAQRCPAEGTHLQRYARVFPCAEINSSFHRPHASSTYEKWARSTPAAFQFAVKLPRLITHEQRLRRSRAAFEQFLAETDGLARHRGPLLAQLPPSFAFEPRAAARFFDMVRARYEGTVVCEPRHPTWFSPRAQALLTRYAVARVAADPAITAGSQMPGGWDGLAYFRLHGAPRMYWSRYDGTYLSRLASVIRQLSQAVDVWCVFDNTASGAAIENAWELRELLK